MNSLRARLLVIIGGSLVILWTIVAVWMMIGLRDEVRTTLDQRLAASARMVAGLAVQLAKPQMSEGRASRAMMDVVARDGIACEVSLLRGELTLQKVARTGGSPPMEDAAPGYSTQEYGGKLWRTYVLQQGSIRVATADRIDQRANLLRDVAFTAAVPFAVALAGSLLMLWIGIGRGLAPVEKIRGVLAARKPGDDAPLPPAPVPQEMKPLVDTIAQLLERVRGALARERRFTDDAAHELRTPLAAIKTHLQVLRLALRGCADNRDISEALDHADEGVVRMQRTLDQLLMLARLDGEQSSQQQQTCNAAEAAAKATLDAEGACASPGRVLLRQPADALEAAIPEALLASALRNLLDNSLRLAPKASPVILQIARRDAQVVFSVLDDGPGLSEPECALATQRFWRTKGGGQGSGLGLSITAAVAEHYGGSLTLSPRIPRGLQAEVAVPIAESRATVSIPSRACGCSKLEV